GQTQPFAATALDQFGIALASQPAVTWSASGDGGGSIDASGAYTADASGGGSETVTAAVAGAAPASASFTVVPAGSSLTVTPADAQPFAPGAASSASLATVYDTATA